MLFQTAMMATIFFLSFSTASFAQNAPSPGKSRSPHSCCQDKIKPAGQPAAAGPQEQPKDGKAFCYNYKRPDKKNTPCPCTYHRDEDGKCRPVWQQGPNQCTNHCKADMCKCTNPCKS